MAANTGRKSKIDQLEHTIKVLTHWENIAYVEGMVELVKECLDRKAKAQTSIETMRKRKR